MTTKTLKLNMGFGAYGMKGAKVRVDVDDKGVPVLRFWRRRVSEAQHNNCVEWVEEKAKPKSKSQKRSQVEESTDGSSDDNQST